MTVRPYADAARQYWRAGWANPIPVKGKWPPPPGYTGYEGRNVSAPDLQAWIDGEEAGQNIALRLPGDVVGIDVDAYDTKTGDISLAAAEEVLGPLPATVRSTSRPPFEASGIRFYRVPTGVNLRGAEKRFRARFGDFVDIIRRDHRYAVVWPSVHPDTGNTYRWYGPDDAVAEIPRPTELPELPPAWVEFLTAPTDPPDAPDASGDAPLSSANDSPWDLPRQFTRTQAIEFVRPFFEALRTAPVGTINNRLNDAAVTLGHFVPAFWTPVEATRFLLNALADTAYDAKTWRAEATIASGLGAKTWRAELVEEADPKDQLSRLRAELLDSAGLDTITDLRPLVRGWLSLNTVARINGKSTHGKSFVVLDICGHIGTGRAWHNHAVTQGLAVYLVAEGAQGLRKRVRAWEHYYGIRMTNVLFLPRPVNAKSPEWAVLQQVMSDLKPVLIAIDTQARVTVGMDENDNSEMGVLVDRLELMRRETGACVLLVHHLGHSGEEGRGATAVKAAVQTELLVVRKDGVVAVSSPKQKDDASDLVQRFEMKLIQLDDPDPLGELRTSVVLVPVSATALIPQDWIENATENQAKILGVVADHFPLIGGTKVEVRMTLIERFGPMARTSFNRAWDSLVGKGHLVQRQNSQKYVLASQQSSDANDL